MTIKALSDAANVLHQLAFDPVLEKQINTNATRLRDALAIGGCVIATGMGKAGHISRKFAATLSSCGIPAHYVHPGEAAHGDLGQIRPLDIIVAFSTSGKTAEVGNLLEYAFQLSRNWTIGITSGQMHTDSVIKLPVMEESDPNNLVPTVSTTVMLSVSDALALRAAELVHHCEDPATRFKEAFAARHHGGYLGAKARDEQDAFLGRLARSGIRG